MLFSLAYLYSQNRYRKSLDELQKNSEKKVALLTSATKKAEVVVRPHVSFVIVNVKSFVEFSCTFSSMKLHQLL